MINRKRLLLALLLVLLTAGLLQAQEDTLLIDDFEHGVPSLIDGFGNGIGLVPWGNQAGNVTLAALQVMEHSEIVLPGQVGANTALEIRYNVPSGGWGGFTHALNDGENWISQDWSAYDALSFWLYGNNTGAQIQIDLFDNRAAGSTTDTAERWYYRVTDDYTGWQQFVIPFTEFQRRTDFQPGGAPNDGLGLTEVSGYAFGFPAVEAQVAYLDNVMLVNQATFVLTTPEVEVVVTAEPTPEGDWALVWSDEFDGEAGAPPDPANWTCETGGHGWGNQEFEYYTDCPANAALSGDGELVITAKQETAENSNCWYGECTYTSSRLISRGKVEHQYGKIEARMKLPFGNGIWPAFWMLGDNFDQVGWPNSGEIDIMEFIGREPTMLYGTIHGPGYSGADGIGGNINLGVPLSDDYHVFGIEWWEGGMDWYVDGQLYHSVRRADVGRREWVYDHPFFLLLNVAVGGNWPGSPDETTTFPQEMRVDYVRWYQWQPK